MQAKTRPQATTLQIVADSIRNGKGVPPLDPALLEEVLDGTDDPKILEPVSDYLRLEGVRD